MGCIQRPRIGAAGAAADGRHRGGPRGVAGLGLWDEDIARRRVRGWPPMRRSLKPPTGRQPPVTDLVLTTAGVRSACSRSPCSAPPTTPTWRDIDALAVVLVLLMTLPAATCRRAPDRVGRHRAHGGAGRRRPRLPADVGMVLGAADRGGRRLSHRPPARASPSGPTRSSAMCWRRSPPPTRPGSRSARSSSSRTSASSASRCCWPTCCASSAACSRRCATRAARLAAAARRGGRRGGRPRARADRSRGPRRRRQRPQRHRGAGGRRDGRWSTRIPTRRGRRSSASRRWRATRWPRPAPPSAACATKRRRRSRRAPGLADLDTLLDAVRASGVEVRVLRRPPTTR